MLNHCKLTKLAGLVTVWLLLLGQMPLVVAQPPHQEAVEPTIVDLAFLDLGYTDQMLRNDGALAQYVLYMPQNFRLSSESYVEIVFSYFMMGGTVPARLEVALNDLALGGVSFSQEELLEEGDQRRIRLPLDETSLKAGRNRLDVVLDTNEVCGTYEPEVEGVIDATSYFHLVYDTPLLEPDLQTYPYPFYERTFRPSQVYIVLSQEPSAADLSAAATISAGLGRLAGSAERLNITSALDTDITPEIRDNHNLIVIGQPGRNRLLDQLPLPLDGPANGVEPDDGVIQVISSPWNPTRAILVVTGQSELALYRASVALHRLPSVPGLRDSAIIVKEVAAPPPAATTRTTVDKTFAQLGYDDITLYGIEARQVRYEFYLPRTWETLEPARLFLSLSHSPILDLANSMLDVYLNETPIGGTLLDENNQTNGLLTLELPDWLLEPGRNHLDIRLEMHLFDEYCVDPNDPSAWTVIFKNSYLHLPLAAGHVEPDLATFPSPFDGDGHYEETVFVVPDEMTAEQRDGLLRLAAYLGESSGSEYLVLRVLRADELSEEIKAQKHLIIVGCPSRNTLLQEQAVAEALPQPFEPGTDTFLLQHDTVVIQPVHGWSIGLLQMFPSPWNSERRILAVTGTTDESIVWSLQALTSSSWWLMGNLVVVDAEGTLRPVGVQEESAQQETPAGTHVVRFGENMERWLMLAEKWW
jgi:hypothetical protein